ncbi:MAG: GNAT family N-acetyltransferase [Gammaproteobacteria bacterium]
MNPNILIRPAIVAEQELLEALQTRASINNPGDREALLANPSAIELPLEQIRAGGVFVLDFGGDIVGFAAILPRADGNVELDALFVEPAAWRRGYGRILIDHCADVARAAGSATLHVTGNPHAKQFYLACQFTQVGSVETRFGIGYLFQKAL